MSDWKRSKPKDWEKSSPLQQRVSTIQLGKKYGYTEQDFQDDEGNDTDRTMQDAIIEKMNADYDVRESMKYGRDSGNKHFKDIGNSIGSMTDAVNASRAIVKYGQKNTDNEDFNVHDDFADVSNKLFNSSRENFGDQFATKDDLSALEEQQKQAVEQETPYEPSAELVAAKDKVQAWEQGGLNPGTPSPYGKESASTSAFNAAAQQTRGGGVSTSVDSFASKVADRDNNPEGAQAFANDFKKDVKKAANFKPNF